MSLTQPKPKLGLADLHVELLFKICKSFCWHCHGFCYLDLIQIMNEHEDNDAWWVADSAKGYSFDQYGDEYDDSSDSDADFEKFKQVAAVDAYSDDGDPQYDDAIFFLHNGKSSLISLSRTCKRLRAVVQPFVYHTLFFSDAQCTPYRLLNIINLFKIRHDLSSSVYELYLDDYPYWAGNKYKRIAKIKQGPLTASFLQLALNLQHAHIRMPGESYQGLSNALHPKSTKSGTRSRPPPQNLKLKHLAVEGRLLNPGTSGRKIFKGPVHADTWLGPLLKLSARTLETLKFHQSVTATERFAASLGRKSLKDPTPLQNLTELTLVENRHDTANSLTLHSLRNILQAVGPHLAKVRIEELSWRPTDGFIDQARIDTTELLKELLSWKETMRELSLIYPAWAFVDETNMDIALLAEFQKLENISFGVGAATDPSAFVAALSPRLRHIKLINDPPDGLYPEILQCLVDACRAGQFPHLETVWVKEPDYGDEQDDVSTKRFGQPFWDACGVRYTSEVYVGENDGISQERTSTYPIKVVAHREIPREWEEAVYGTVYGKPRVHKASRGDDWGARLDASQDEFLAHARSRNLRCINPDPDPYLVCGSDSSCPDCEYCEQWKKWRLDFDARELEMRKLLSTRGVFL